MWLGGVEGVLANIMQWEGRAGSKVLLKMHLRMEWSVFMVKVNPGIVIEVEEIAGLNLQLHFLFLVFLSV